MSREAVSATRALGPPDPPSGRRRSALWILIAVLAAELLLLALVWRSGKPWLPVGLALVPAFFLLAFRSPGLAWGAVWIAAPLSMQRLLPGGNAVQFPTEPMIAIALAAWGMRSLLTPGFRIPGSRLHVPLGALAAIALLSAVMGPHPVVSLKAWVVAAGYAAFGYLYFLSAPCDPARRERWLRLAVATGALVGLYGFARVLSLGVTAREAYGLGRPFFPEHGTYSAYIAMLLPLALLLALTREGRARRAYAAGAVAIALGIVFSFTRAAWISLAVVLPIALGIWAARRRSWKPVLASAAMALVVAALLAGSGAIDPFSRHARSVVDPENVSNLERLNRWIAAAEMVKDRPVLGVGIGGYASSYPVYRRKLVITEMAYEYMGAHSEPLRVLSEMGILGFLAALWFLGAVAGVGLGVILRGGGATSVLALGLLAGLATYAVHGVFNTYLEVDKAAVPFWAGIGALAALARPAEESALSTPAAPR